MIEEYKDMQNHNIEFHRFIDIYHHNPRMDDRIVYIKSITMEHLCFDIEEVLYGRHQDLVLLVVL